MLWLGWAGSVFFLFFGVAVFAVLGTVLFGATRAGLSLVAGRASFRTFPASTLTLCQLLLGREWLGLMGDCRSAA